MSREERESVREEVIESMERSAEVYGLSRSAGRIYGVLYFADSPLSIPELVERTGYAKSTISNVTRRLTRVGLVRRRSSSGGGRRVRFQPETDLWFVVQDVIGQYVQRETSVTQRTLDGALDDLNDIDDEAADADRERVRELRSTYDELRQVLELVTEHSTDELVEAIEAYEDD